MHHYKIILASRSPRRREILSALGVSFEIVSADADESSEETDPTRLAPALALKKGRATRDLLVKTGKWTEDTVVIAADTVVAVDGRILGKPRDEEEARAMLRSLSGRSHTVVSGIALLTDRGERTAAESTGVSFTALSESDIARYVASGEPMDKAGAYAVQGRAALWINRLDGDYFNVVGLPVHRLNELSRAFLSRDLLDL